MFELHVRQTARGWQYGISGRSGLPVFTDLAFKSRKDAELIGNARIAELNEYAYGKEQTSVS